MYFTSSGKLGCHQRGFCCSSSLIFLVVMSVNWHYRWIYSCVDFSVHHIPVFLTSKTYSISAVVNCLQPTKGQNTHDFLFAPFSSLFIFSSVSFPLLALTPHLIFTSIPGNGGKRILTTLRTGRPRREMNVCWLVRGWLGRESSSSVAMAFSGSVLINC